MNINNLKKKIEEKRIALDKLRSQFENEQQKKRLFFKNKKRIKELDKQITDLGDELAELEGKYHSQLELEEIKRDARDKRLFFIKKYGLKAGIAFIAVSAVYCGYLPFKTLNINGEQMTYRAMIGSFEDITVSSADYTPETYERYINNLENAKVQKNDIFMSDEEKLEYIEAVSSAYEALEPIPDKKDLLTALNEANAYDLSTFTPASVKKFKTVITQTKEIYNDSNATKKEVTDAEKSIAAAYSKLTLKADKTELAALVGKYSDFALDEYTPSSVKSFNQAIQYAERLVDDENAVQKKVDEQVQSMQAIETLLVRKADKSALQGLIDEYNGLNKDNYKSGYDEMLSEVKSVTYLLDDADASQEIVDSAVSRLQVSRSNLVEYTTYVYRINMHAARQYNNHIGEDFIYDRYYNGGYIHDGFEVTGTPGTYAEVGMQITEDDKIPDTGYGGAAIYLQDGYETSFDVSVVENQGRYAGYDALFTVNVTVTFLRRE